MTTTTPQTPADRLTRALILGSVPADLHGGLIRYILDGVPTGGFLLAVLSNDLRQACDRADHVNKLYIAQIVGFLNTHAPADCWGSAERVVAWLKQHHARRQAESEATVKVRCTDCSWHGTAGQLKANACPDCDGRVGEEV